MQGKLVNDLIYSIQWIPFKFRVNELDPFPKRNPQHKTSLKVHSSSFFLSFSYSTS